MPRPPNKELILHEKKRKIEGELFTMGKKLREEGKLSEEDIKEKLRQERQRMHDDLKNEGAINFKNSHEAALAKQKHMEKLKSAMKIRDDFESGAAFDQELQD